MVEGASECPSCGAYNPRGKNYCSLCGKSLKRTQTEALPDAEKPTQARLSRPVMTLLGVLAVLLILGGTGYATSLLTGEDASLPRATDSVGESGLGGLGSEPDPVDFEGMPEILPEEAARSPERIAMEPHFQLTGEGYRLVKSQDLVLDPEIDVAEGRSYCGAVEYGVGGPYSPNGVSFIEGIGITCNEIFALLVDWLRTEGEGVPQGWVCLQSPEYANYIECRSGNESFSFLPF